MRCIRGRGLVLDGLDEVARRLPADALLERQPVSGGRGAYVRDRGASLPESPACVEGPLLAELRCHDLRHTATPSPPRPGASTKQLMAGMGHPSMRAALIYQHASSNGDAAIASARSQLALGETTTTEPTGHQRPTPRAAGRHVRVLLARSGHAEIVRVFGGLRGNGMNGL